MQQRGVDAVFEIRDNGPTEITGSTFRNNDTSVSRGSFSGARCEADTGGLSIGGISPVVSIRGTTIVNNHVSCSGTDCTVQAGGIDSTGGGSTTITNSTISSNSTSGSGGGLLMNFDGNVFRLNNVTITGNTADADNDGVGDGGGVAQSDGGVIEFGNTIIAGNSDRGGDGPHGKGS
ncbi:MAG: hypothetical protein GY732_21675 [Gammaproteobacteria bacterium]|nr:hypothetical protein [Gammaproteobacteria bacterium]